MQKKIETLIVGFTRTPLSDGYSRTRDGNRYAVQVFVQGRCEWFCTGYRTQREADAAGEKEHARRKQKLVSTMGTSN